jgi:hypothetical protein
MEEVLLTAGIVGGFLLMIVGMHWVIEGQAPGPIRTLARRRRERRTRKNPAVCGCEHHLAFHGTDGGSCGFIRQVGNYGKDDVLCGCKRFVSKANPTAALIELGERGL